MRPHMDTFRRSSPIKLKRKGAYRTGLTIGDAQANARLSGNDSYTFQDFNADMTGRIHLKIRVSVNRLWFEAVTECGTFVI